MNYSRPTRTILNERAGTSPDQVTRHVDLFLTDSLVERCAEAEHKATRRMNTVVQNLVQPLTRIFSLSFEKSDKKIHNFGLA